MSASLKCKNYLFIVPPSVVTSVKVIWPLAREDGPICTAGEMTWNMRRRAVWHDMPSACVDVSNDSGAPPARTLIVSSIDRLVVKRTDWSTSHEQVTSSAESRLPLATVNNAGESLMNFCILATQTKLELIPRTRTYLNHLLTISPVK